MYPLVVVFNNIRPKSRVSDRLLPGTRFCRMPGKTGRAGVMVY